MSDKGVLIGTIDFGEDFGDCIDADSNIELIDINEDNISTGKDEYHDPVYGKCNVNVYADEGDTPHFHVSPSTGRPVTCIKIEEAKFFNHAKGQIAFRNNHQCKKLDEWCREDNAASKKNGKPCTNWQAICREWNKASDNKVDEEQPQPDYRQLIYNGNGC